MGMLRINQHNKDVEQILKDSNLTSKIQLFFSTKTWGEDADPCEGNYTLSKLNPKTIRGYVTEVSASSLVWKSYGLHNMGAKEILCDSRYKTWFQNCAKIMIDNEEFQTYREATGGRAIISERKFKMIRVLVAKRTQ